MRAARNGRPASPLDGLLSSTAFIADPYPVYRALRDEHPLYWSATWGVWVLSRHDDVVAVLRDSARFSSSGRFNALLELFPPQDETALEPLARFGRGAFNVDPPVHTRLRRILRNAFGPAAMDALRPRVATIVADLLDRAEAAGPHLDLVRDFALPLPVSVICELLGATEAERAGFEDWATAILDFLATGTTDPTLARRAADALGSMEDRFAAILDQRRRTPRHDLLTLLSHAVAAGDLAPSEAPLVAAELMIAGHHTTKDLIANAVITLAHQPAARAAVIAEPSLLPGVVEEVLRFESSIQRGWRRAAEDVDLHGRRIRAGDLVFLMIGAANRDSATFPEPDRFDIHRTPNRHLAFGYGIHLCIGAPLARLEAPIALEALSRRAPRLELSSPTIDWYPSIHIRGPRTLQVTLA